MLSFEEMDNLVTNQLDCLNPKQYQVTREHRGQTVLYTITKSGNLLGRYRVGKKPDGGAGYGPIQGDNSPEWHFLWEGILNRTLERADGTMTEAAERDYQRRQEFYLKQIQERKANELPAPVDAAQVGAGKPEAQELNSDAVEVLSDKTKALNRLAVLWVKHNQGRISRDENMEWFINENAKAVGLVYLTVNEFKKHLPKAHKAEIIDKDKKTGRFIPKLGT